MNNETTKIAVKIDWLTITGKASLGDIVGGHLSAVTAEWFAKDRLSYLLQDFQALEQQKGNGFYQYAFLDKVTGCTFELSESLDVQGWKFTMPGSAAITDDTRQAILQRAVDANFKVTRIDVAIDIINDAFIKPDKIRNMYERETHDKRRLSTDYKESIKGDTFYIGSRESAYFLRVYDKGKQQGLSDDWTRFELEMKEYGASGYAETLAFDPALAAREIRRMLDLPGSRIDYLLTTLLDPVERERPKAPKSKPDTVVWFDTTVSAAFRNLCKDDLEAAERVMMAFQGYFTEGFAVHQIARMNDDFAALPADENGVIIYEKRELK